MVVYKDEKTWTVQCRIKNRDGTTKQHKKRGFLTKKEAKEYESKITSKVPKCHMKLSEFYEIYLLDKKNELKYRTILTKRQMIETHILPYFGEMLTISPGSTSRINSAPIVCKAQDSEARM